LYKKKEKKEEKKERKKKCSLCDDIIHSACDLKPENRTLGKGGHDPATMKGIK